jgi:hypothetical protein
MRDKRLVIALLGMAQRLWALPRLLDADFWPKRRRCDGQSSSSHHLPAADAHHCAMLIAWHKKGQRAHTAIGQRTRVAHTQYRRAFAPYCNQYRGRRYSRARRTAAEFEGRLAPGDWGLVPRPPLLEPPAPAGVIAKTAGFPSRRILRLYRFPQAATSYPHGRFAIPGKAPYFFPVGAPLLPRLPHWQPTPMSGVQN